METILEIQCEKHYWLVFFWIGLGSGLDWNKIGLKIFQ